MVDIYIAAVVSQEILAAGYALVFIYTLYIVKSNYANDSPLIRKYYYFLLLNCVLRFGYFVVPPKAWGLDNDEPQDLERFGASWWSQWANNSLYVLGNTCMEACYIYVLKMWANAQSVVSGRSTERWRRFLDILLLGYTLWNFALMIMYIFMQYHTVLVCAAVVTTVVRAVEVFGYITSWQAIWQALDATAQRPNCAKLLFSSSSYQPLPTQPLLHIDMDQQNMQRARDMLAKITRVSLCFTVFAAIKLGILVYMIARLGTNTLSKDEKYWWFVILVDYLLAEIASGGIVLYTLRKQKPQRAEAPGSPASRTPQLT